MTEPHYRLGQVGQGKLIHVIDTDGRPVCNPTHRPQDGKGGYSDHSLRSPVHRKGVGVEARITCSKCLKLDLVDPRRRLKNQQSMCRQTR